jgi:hypothetical protein
MLFPSTLIISSQTEVIDDIISSLLNSLDHLSLTNNPDIYQISEAGDYTIDNIRQIKKFLSQQPYNHSSKMIIIKNAHLLNTESQNALLKSLEEPSENNYFILSTGTPGNLLPTIVSRCHLLRPNPINTKTLSKPLTFPDSISSSLLTADTLYQDKTSLLVYLQTQISIFQKQLVTNPTPQTITIINKLIKCTLMLNANVDPKSALDFLLLSN